MMTNTRMIQHVRSEALRIREEEMSISEEMKVCGIDNSQVIEDLKAIALLCDTMIDRPGMSYQQ